MDGEELVFVYGTLRRGYANHHLMRGARDLGPARTKQSHALYLGEFPYLIKDQAVCPISGELYGVSPTAMKLLDQLEENPDWYCRELAPVLDAQGAEHQAWIYFFPQPQGRLLATGDLGEAPEYGGVGGA